ncbi:MAG: hypothetical protein NTX00_00745, partial [Candidatus Parcubacteria bacterium]|nr:hypothetical protein [Candidatus Parcubacteria bacterium]
NLIVLIFRISICFFYYCNLFGIASQSSRHWRDVSVADICDLSGLALAKTSFGEARMGEALRSRDESFAFAPRCGATANEGLSFFHNVWFTLETARLIISSGVKMLCRF